MRTLLVTVGIAVLGLIALTGCQKDVGGVCAADDECKPGLVCYEGACFKLHAAGEACAAKAECEPNLVCYAGACFAPLAAGGACADVAQCQAGLVCLDGACFALLAEGGACTASAQCQQGLACGAGRCVPAKKEGEACAEAPCDAGLVCLAGFCATKDAAAARVAAAKQGLEAWARVGAACARVAELAAVTDPAQAEAATAGQAEARALAEGVTASLLKDNAEFKVAFAAAYQGVSGQPFQSLQDVAICDAALRDATAAALTAIASAAL